MMMQSSIKRFDFEGLQDFRLPPVPYVIANDHTLPEEAEEFIAPPPPSFSQAELDAAKKIAFEEGRLAGANEEKERQDAHEKANREQVVIACKIMCERAADMQRNLASFKETQTTELAALLQMLVEKIAGDALMTAPHKAVERMIQDCLGVLQSQPRVTIQVHPTCFAAIEETLRITAAQYHLENSITLRENSDLGLSDVRMSWGNGNAERSLREMWQQIESLIASIDFSTLAHESAAPTAAENDESNTEQSKQSQQGDDHE